MTRCPETTVLRRLEAGELSDDEAAGLTPHVQTCGTCAEVLDQLRAENLDARVIRAALKTDDVTLTIEPGTPRTPGRTTGERRREETWEIPDYERVRECGQGAYGTVWAVRDRVGVYRALKTIDLDRLRAANVQCRESTALEAYCRRVQRHPNLIEIHHVGMQGNLLYYTMELADDDSTRKPVHHDFPASYCPLTLKRIIRSGPISVDTSVEVTLRLLSGLSRLHAVGLAHRDIKPANIVFVQRRPKLADIGMITANTTGPSSVGTPQYMPPDGRMDLTADTYAMGRVFYQLMVGPDHDDFPNLPDHLIGSSDKWDLDKISAVLATAAAPSANDRFPNADRMIEELEASRELTYESLFAELDSIVDDERKAPANPYAPIIIAAINALPWVFVILLLIVFVQKLL